MGIPGNQRLFEGFSCIFPRKTRNARPEVFASFLRKHCRDSEQGRIREQVAGGMESSALRTEGAVFPEEGSRHLSGSLRRCVELHPRFAEGCASNAESFLKIPPNESPRWLPAASPLAPRWLPAGFPLASPQYLLPPHQEGWAVARGPHHFPSVLTSFLKRSAPPAPVLQFFCPIKVIPYLL